MPAKRTLRASGRSRAPPQAAHVTSSRNVSSRSRVCGLVAVTYSFSKSVTKPGKFAVAAPESLNRRRLPLRERRVPLNPARVQETAQPTACIARVAACDAPFHAATAPLASDNAGSGKHQLLIELHSRPQPLAHRARPIGAIEAERSRLDLLEAGFAVRARVECAEQLVLPGFTSRLLLAALFAAAVALAAHLITGDQRPFAVRERQLNRLGQPVANAFANHNAIDHRLDRVILPRLKLRWMLDIDHLAIHACPQ